MPKKIMHITLATGGVKTYVAHVLNFANSDLFKFVVVASKNAAFEEFCAEKSIYYHHLDLDRDNNPIRNLTALYKLIGIINKEKPDLIHAHSAKGGFLGRLAARWTHTKIVYTPHAFSYLSFTGIKRMVFFLLELSVKKYTTRLLAISYSEANRAIYELGFKATSVEVILNAIPIETVQTQRDYSFATTIGMIGRLTLQKNHFQFLETAKLLVKSYPNLRFSILGAGIHDHLMTPIVNFINSNNLNNNVFIEQWGDVKKGEQFLKETDIYVMTSVFEGLPFSLLEAMSLGIPCVVSKVDGNTDVINNNENGYSCLSVEDFVRNISRLLDNADLRAIIGQAGREYVENSHNMSNAIIKIEKVYLET